MPRFCITLLSCAIATVVSSPATARPMEKVLFECASSSPYPAYVDCIKARYSKVGNTKKDGTVWAFYALLDEIGDAYAKAKATADPMTENQARGNVYRAWQSTINASNQKETGKICSMEGTALKCQ